MWSIERTPQLEAGAPHRQDARFGGHPFLSERLFEFDVRHLPTTTHLRLSPHGGVQLVRLVRLCLRCQLAVGRAEALRRTLGIAQLLLQLQHLLGRRRHGAANSEESVKRKSHRHCRKPDAFLRDTPVPSSTAGSSRCARLPQGYQAALLIGRNASDRAKHHISETSSSVL